MRKKRINLPTTPYNELIQIAKSNNTIVIPFPPSPPTRRLAGKQLLLMLVAVEGDGELDYKRNAGTERNGTVLARRTVLPCQALELKQLFCGRSLPE